MKTTRRPSHAYAAAFRDATNGCSPGACAEAIRDLRRGICDGGIPQSGFTESIGDHQGLKATAVSDHRRDIDLRRELAPTRR